MLPATYQVIDYFNENPSATAADAIAFFGKEFEIQKQIDRLKNEGREFSRIRAQLRPLWGEKRDVEERLRYELGEIELMVMVKYPPRKGSEKEREAYRGQLKKENEDYQKLDQRNKELSDRIAELEHELDEVDRDAKNARRITELYERYIQFIMDYKKNIPVF